MLNGIIFAMLFYLCCITTVILCSRPTKELRKTCAHLEWINQMQDLQIKALKQEEASIKDTLEVYIESLQELEAQQKLNDFHRGSLFAYERALRLMEFEEDEQEA